MFKSFRDKHTERLAAGERIHEWDAFHRQSEKRLRILDAATALEDLGPELKQAGGLKGDHKGQYSIRINSQWRLCFKWPKGALGPTDVEIVAYD